MRDFFAILAIILAVITLGVFRLPEENALISAGIKAEAEGLVYQAKHPIRVGVENSVITVSGRVESEAAAQAIITDLSKIDSVKSVRSELRVLPSASPFALRISKTADEVNFAGHVVTQSQADALNALFDTETGLSPATGRPDGEWRGVAMRGAEVVNRLQTGRMDLVDQSLRITGDVLLPREEAALEASLTEMPEGYSAHINITALDDGQPYRLNISRDPLMGLRISGKMPPEWDPAQLDALGPAKALEIRAAPQPLDAPGFEEAVDLFLPLMVDSEFIGDVLISSGLVSIKAGPLADDKIARIRDRAERLPPTIGSELVLIPEDTGDTLAIELVWDGETVLAKGRVPSDFDAAALAERLGLPFSEAISRGPYPDLADWSTRVQNVAGALRFLENGRLNYDGEAISLRGTALDPSKRRAAMTLAGDETDTDIQLIDDGSPPEFTLRYDPAGGASVEGKLPKGLTPEALAEALGVAEIRARVRVSTTGSGNKLLDGLRALVPHMTMLDLITLEYSETETVLTAAAEPGIDLALLAPVITGIPDELAFDLTSAEPHLSGTRRVHAMTGQAQIFAGGYWLPELPLELTADSCTVEAGLMPEMSFEPQSFALGLATALPMNHLTAIARACLDLGGLRMEIEGRANTASAEVLNPQLGRRRADAIRRELINRGFDGENIRAKSGQAGAQENVAYRFSKQ